MLVFVLTLDGSISTRKSKVFAGRRGLMLLFMVGLSVAKVVKCKLGDNNEFMLVFDLRVAEEAEFSVVQLV